MKKVIDEYYQDKECYPQELPVCTNPFLINNTVLKDVIPCDPGTTLSYTYVPEISDCPSWFQLYTNLEYTQDIIIDKIGCREGCGPDCQFNYGVSSPNQRLDPYCGEMPAPPDPVIQYACSPGSVGCVVYVDPELGGCPTVFINDPTCQDACSIKENRCHDSRGKMN